jgi:hypothetical protein
MNKAAATRSLLLVAFFGLCALSAYAANSSCIECHTNAATMQKLVKPPQVGSAEGEG